jgi:hypothetical protein
MCSLLRIGKASRQQAAAPTLATYAYASYCHLGGIAIRHGPGLETIIRALGAAKLYQSPDGPVLAFPMILISLNTPTSLALSTPFKDVSGNVSV